ncbi:MAG: serine hydrolase domain-containing protein [Gaiellales bacterium]
MGLQIVDTWVTDQTVPSVAAAVVDARGVRETRVAGAARADSLFALASLTKPLVAVAAMVAVEEGAIDLDAPVGDHLAEYRDGPRAGITPRHLLAHASGLPESARGVPALDVLPVNPPGTRRAYSNEGFHVLGALLAAATGIPHQEYVREALFEPLRMDAHMPLPEHEYGRALDVAEPGLAAPGVPLFNAPEWRRRGTAAGGAFATVEAYARFLQMLLARGAPLLAEATYAELAAVQFPGIPGGLESFPRLVCPDWGLGVNIRGTGSPHWAGDRVSPATLTHFGASGTLMWVDPRAGTGLVCLANRGTYSGWMMRPGHWLDLADAVLAA